jgi:hypothetical protein
MLTMLVSFPCFHCCDKTPETSNLQFQRFPSLICPGAFGYMVRQNIMAVGEGGREGCSPYGGLEAERVYFYNKAPPPQPIML